MCLVLSRKYIKGKPVTNKRIANYQLVNIEKKQKGWQLCYFSNTDTNTNTSEPVAEKISKGNRKGGICVAS